jgi:hypothetical protein
MSRAPQLRDARERARAAQQHDDDDDDVAASARRGGDDDDDRGGGRGSGSSDDDDDDDDDGSERSKKKKALAAAAAAEAARNNEIVVERTVIHEALLRRAIHKDLATFYDAAVVPLEHEIDLESQERLVLSFCNIYAINNLAGFEKLKHLQLDNNIIDRIQNLDHLTNLRWLDLSFNNIRQIRGLEALVQLTDLSLTDNEITTIEGLDTLTNLNVLSLGNNKIASLSCVLPLRKFKKLRALNLKGNPVTQEDDYLNSLCAYLTNLRYLDHRIIEASQFARARDAKLDQLLVLEAKEKAEEVLEKERVQQEQAQKLLDEANLAGLSSLFTDMVRSDTEHNKIRVLPGFDALMKGYKESFAAIVEEFSQHILQKHDTKKEEVRLAEEVLDKIHGNAVRESRSELDRFRHLAKKAFKTHSETCDRGSPDRAILPALRAELSAVVQELLAIEMLLVEQIESVLEEFEKCYAKLIQENVLRINGAFRSLLDASSKHLSNVYELTHSLLERSAKGDESLASGADDVDVRALLADKDVLNNAVTTSHENQEAKIAAKEDEVRDREEKAGKALIKKMRDAHRARNRKRVAEIYAMKSIEEAAIAQQEAQQDDDDDA